MENKNKSGFLIICGGCILLLLVMFYFGISDTMKGTQATLTCYCPNGYSDNGDGRCYKTIQLPQTCKTHTNSYNCSNSSTNCCNLNDESACTYVPSSGAYTCSCTSTWQECTDGGTTKEYVDKICSSGSQENCNGHPGEGWSCGYYNVADYPGKVCYIDCVCTDQSKCGNDDPYDDSFDPVDVNKYTCDNGKTVQSSSVCTTSEEFVCDNTSCSVVLENKACAYFKNDDSWSGECTKRYLGNDKYTYDCECTREADLVVGSDACPANPGDDFTCTAFSLAGNVCYTDCVKDGFNVGIDGDVEKFCPLGTEYDETYNKCISTKVSGTGDGYFPECEEEFPGWSCSIGQNSDGTSYFCQCDPEEKCPTCGEDDSTTDPVSCPAGSDSNPDNIKPIAERICGTGNYELINPKVGCYSYSCINPPSSGSSVSGKYGCWLCDGVHTIGWSSTYEDECTWLGSSCPNNPSNPGGSTTPSDGAGTPDDDPGDGENKQPSNEPDNGDNDNDGIPDNADPDDDNDGILDSVDPEPSKPTGGDNIPENPQTGQIAMFVVWLLALISIIYFVWYFRKEYK